MALTARGRMRRGTPISLLTAAAAVVASLAAFAASTEAAKPPMEAAVAVNVKRVLHRTGDFFLGLQLDPVELIDAHEHRWNSARALTLAKGLAPAYLRVAGPGTDSLLLASSGNTPPNNVTEAEWLLLTRFCAAAGLRPAVAVSAAARLAGAWDPRPALPLLGLAASLGCDLTLQLGFEPQEASYLQPSGGGAASGAGALAGAVAAAAAAAGAAAGAQAGRDAAALRRLLDAFPQCAARARMLAPAVTRVRAPQDVAFVRAALDAAAPIAAAAVAWNPSMWEPAEGAPGGALGPKARPRPLDQLLAERDALLRMIPRTAPSRHSPLWIGEPWAEASGAARGGVDAWERALRWARRLGMSARLGAAVALHPLDAHALLDPPPAYWVSLLHRRLVGDGVFEARVAGGGRRLDVFCRCAARSPGALLVMAVNGARARVRLALKGLPSAAAAHAAGSPGVGAPGSAALQYVLTHREGETLLNGRPLRLSSNDSLPALEPRSLPPPPPPSAGAHSHSHGAQPLLLSVPPRAVAFWVLPGAGVRMCFPPVASAAAFLGRAESEEEAEDYEAEGEEEGEESDDAAVPDVETGRRRRLGAGLHALQRLRAAPEGVSSGDYEEQDDEYDYYNDDPDPAEEEQEAHGGAGGESSPAAVVGQSAEAVWSIAQATLLSDRRTTVGVAGGGGGGGDDDEEQADPARAEPARADPAHADTDSAPQDMPAPMPKEREKYLKTMFVNAITKGPDAQERSRRVRRAVPSPPGPAFVLAALPPPPPLPGARKTLAKPWKREREDLAERLGRTPRRGAKARDPEEEKMEAIFGQPQIDLEPAGGSNDPVEEFPVGDVFVEEGKADTSMDRNKDYDYVEEDSEELHQMRRRARGRGRGRRRRPTGDRGEGEDNRIAEYKHSELFEELGVTHAPKDVTAPPPCTHELQEATALRDLPPGPSASRPPNGHARGTADSAVAGDNSAIIAIETEIIESAIPSKAKTREDEEMVKQGKRVTKNIRNHGMNSYTHTTKYSEEKDDYGDTEEMASDYDSLTDSLDFEEAIARRHRSEDDDWISDLHSCEAPDWPINVHDKFPTCNV